MCAQLCISSNWYAFAHYQADNKYLKLWIRTGILTCWWCRHQTEKSKQTQMIWISFIFFFSLSIYIYKHRFVFWYIYTIYIDTYSIYIYNYRRIHIAKSHVMAVLIRNECVVYSNSYNVNKASQHYICMYSYPFGIKCCFVYSKVQRTYNNARNADALLYVPRIFLHVFQFFQIADKNT